MPRKIGLEKQPQKLVIFFHFLSLLPWLICAQQRQEVYFEEGGYRVPVNVQNKLYYFYLIFNLALKNSLIF